MTPDGCVFPGCAKILGKESDMELCPRDASFCRYATGERYTRCTLPGGVSECERSLRAAIEKEAKMASVEMCCKCDEPTGRAGRGDDSIGADDGSGPYCENCQSRMTKERKLDNEHEAMPIRDLAWEFHEAVEIAERIGDVLAVLDKNAEEDSVSFAVAGIRIEVDDSNARRFLAAQLGGKLRTAQYYQTLIAARKIEGGE